MHKYTFVKLLEEVQQGYEFSWSSWPLHLTIVDDFFISWDELEIYRKLKAALAGQPPVKTTARNDSNFGPLKDIPVTTLERTPDLMDLHLKLIELLKGSGVVFVTPEFSGAGYRPHATIQINNRLRAGDEVTVDAISIIDMSLNGDPSMRKLVHTVKLQS